MSACSNTLRALSRSRIPTNKTLLPFLYQTATIQQWKPAAQHVARRNISRYSRKDDTPAEDIPFENKDDLPPAVDDLESPRKTTITTSERAAFQKLYRKFNARGSRQEEKDHEVEIDAIADEYWEPDEDENPKASLDKIFDEAMKKGAAASREWNRLGTEQLRSRKPRQDLQSMAEHVLKGTRPMELEANEVRARRKEETNTPAVQLKKARMRERKRIDDLLLSARTDHELWSTLETEVFEQVRRLDLDSTAPKPKSHKNSRTRKGTKPAPDSKILFANYPHHLLTALTTLRTQFPASAFPLLILPKIKSLGRSSFALGATTALYTQLLRTAWLQQCSYPLLCTLLTEMHNAAIEFNLDTLTLLDKVIKEYEMARSGRLSREMQMVYGMEQFGEGIREVRRWRAVVAERVGVEDGRREKGTVPVPRRRSAVQVQGEGQEDQQQHVPLVEGLNAAAHNGVMHSSVGDVSEHASQPAFTHDIDPGVGFGFLSEEDVTETSRDDHQIGVPVSEYVGKPEGNVDETVEEKVQDDIKDDIENDIKQEADKAQITAKPSTGEFVP